MFYGLFICFFYDILGANESKSLRKEEENMKFSSKIERCGLSPMRKFAPYAVKAEQAGKKIYHLNIGQPDIEIGRAHV